jgi:hypothetical protein
MAPKDTTGTSTDLAIPETTKIVALTMTDNEASELAEVLLDNLSGSGAIPFPRVPIPAGGSTTWEIPLASGVRKADEIVGVIVARQIVRVYWEKGENGASPLGGEPPKCFSPDGHLGTGEPGGDCASCPLAKFGSATNGSKGQACAQRMNLAMLTEFSALPLIISAPPSSLKALNQYMVALAGESKSYRAVITRIGLRKEANAGGQSYGVLVPSLERPMTAEERSNAKLLSESLARCLGTVEATTAAATEAE